MPLNGNTIVSVSADVLCDRDPLEPVKTIELTPMGIAAGTDTVNCAFESAATVSGNTDDVVMPSGSPEIAIETLPVKPLRALIETVIGALVDPCATLTEPVVEIEKSGGGGGGGGGETFPPPHATSKEAIIKSTATACRLGMASPGADSAVCRVLERNSELRLPGRLVLMGFSRWKE